MKLNEEINRAVRRGDLFKRYTSTGAEVQPGTPEDFGAFIRQQAVAWGRVIRAGNVKAE
jgi:tripartite-type tricarboxylate transporter receptor subunit TctC